MDARYEPDHELEDRLSRRLLDVFIRGGLVLVLVLLCYLIFAPFLRMMSWALILAVTIYPLHQMVAARIGGKQGLAATLLVLLAVGVIITPTVMLVNEFGDSVQRLINNVQNNTLQVPAPGKGSPVAAGRREGVRVLDEGAHRSARTGAEPAAEDRRPGQGTGFVAALGGGLLRFLFSFVVAGIMMAYGEAGARAIREIFERVADRAREEFVELSTATIRAVASGVLGVAFIQAIIIGLWLLVAGVPWAGVLAVIVLVLGIAQVPALLVTLPAIGYIWSSGKYSTGAAVFYTVFLAVAGMADNVLKPFMLGRGVDAPMPVILLGALGGMAAAGILGMFVGATVLALGYQIFMRWVRQSGAGAANGRRSGSPPLSRCGDVHRRAGARARPRSLLLRGCAAIGPDFKRPWCRGSPAGQPTRCNRLSGRRARPAESGNRGVVAQFRRPGAGPPGGGGPAPQSRRAHCGDAHPRGARAARGCRQLALPATAAGDRQCRAHRRGAASGGNVAISSDNGGLGIGEDLSSGRSIAFTAYNAGLGFGWELDFWGKFRRSIESADAGYFASIAQYDDLQVLMAAQVANSYCAIRTIELRLTIAHENAALQKRSLEITERLFRSGDESELDVQQASAVPGHPVDDSATRGQPAPGANALGVLLARPPGPLPEIADGKDTIPKPNSGLSWTCRPTCCVAGPTSVRPRCRWPRSRRRLA